jgi:hypothetical protein
MFKQKIDFYTKKLLKIINSDNFAVPVFFVSFVVILYNFTFFVAKNTVDIPFWDQWGGVSDTIQEKFNLFKILAYQHNEHRIGIGLLIMKILARYSRWSQVLEIKFISFLVISSSILLAYVKYRVNKKIEILDIIIPLVILNIFQVENITWGFQIAFLLPLFFLCLWVLALKIKSVILRYNILIILSLLSSFSSFHGLILPLMTIVLSFIEYFKYKSIRKNQTILFVTANILIIFLYFVEYTKNFQATLSFVPSWKFIKFFSVAVSNGFFYSPTNITVNIFIAVLVLFFFIMGISNLWRNKEKNENLFIGFLLLSYSLIFTTMISAGRSSFGIESALRSAYITYSMLIPIGLVFIFSSSKVKNYLKTILIIFILLNSIFLTDKLNWYVKYIIGGRQKVLECYKKSSLSSLGACYKVFTLYPSEEYLNQRIVKILQYKKINKFSKSSEIANTISNFPNEVAESRKIPELFTDYQNIKIENSDFISLNNDPIILVAINDSIKGLSWESSATGDTQVFFTFDETSYFSEKNAFKIKPVNGIYIINLEKVREIMGKKIFKLRIDPNDKMENFKISNLKTYQ